MRDLMAGEAPPTMRELITVHFPGRTRGSVDRVCRRYEIPVPKFDRDVRRKRCLACRKLFRGEGAVCCVAPERQAA